MFDSLSRAMEVVSWLRAALPSAAARQQEPPVNVENLLACLPVSKFQVATGASATQCSICWEDQEDGQCALRLPCLHEFHQNCITKWLRTQPTCPLCRTSVARALQDQQQAERALLSGGQP
mmetsp:Transcript_97126/g.222567  ORF Transcript_97126/g.222567 Transcript_97126/m.222567 type:complete len:121 (+) Transcript_97126:146-508(+)